MDLPGKSSIITDSETNSFLIILLSTHLFSLQDTVQQMLKNIIPGTTFAVKITKQ